MEEYLGKPIEEKYLKQYREILEGLKAKIRGEWGDIEYSFKPREKKPRGGYNNGSNSLSVSVKTHEEKSLYISIGNVFTDASKGKECPTPDLVINQTDPKTGSRKDHFGLVDYWEHYKMTKYPYLTWKTPDFKDMQESVEWSRNYFINAVELIDNELRDHVYGSKWEFIDTPLKKYFR